MTFQQLVDLARSRGGLTTDDALACLLPLFRQVAACHTNGLVAPLRGIDALQVDEQYRVSFDDALGRRPGREDRRVEQVQRSVSRAFEVVARAEATTDVVAGEAEFRSLDVLPDGEDVRHPVLVPGWEVWEHRLGHHDALTDVASLGMLLAALVAGLDLAQREDVELLAAHRKNLFALAPALHPVVAGVAARMIEPDRHQRAQDLVSLIERLETYRDQPVDFDLRQVAAERGAVDMRRAILSTLRDRLFDLSRRNRLIWFRPSAQSLNLTETSVPLLLDARNIRPEQLFTWNPAVASRVLSGNPVSLGSAVRWEDAPYANGILDTVISQARRDRQEFGQAQLRLVVAFLRWHDLKGERDERISSPLLLLPVELTKKRGVRDSYLLQALTPEAEVNPALRQHLKQLYDLDLPPTFDLLRERITDLHARLRADIQRTEPAVELRLQDRPRIELIHARALIRLEAFQRRAARGTVTLGRRAYAYSYRRRDYRPLGLQIYLDRVAHRPAPVAALLAETPAVRMPQMAPAITVQKELYQLDDSGGGNPYAWDLDLCALTLANFNYRTMSLVRDYRELLNDGPTSASFERLFSLEPRAFDAGPAAELPLHDRYLVLPSDGSQLAAIAHGRSGRSLVIQGPPGTGKSQTITNLIADYVARGKRVLFVCQKRAAIDVVHARLRQRGLDGLASLIHDSQADKKAFVQGLRATYEAWLGEADAGADAEEQRARLLAAVAAAIAEVEAFERALEPGDGSPGPGLRRIVERLIELRDRRWGDELPPEGRLLLPTPEAWWAARRAVDEVAAALASATGNPSLAASPLRFVAPGLLDRPRPDAELASAAPRAAVQMGEVIDSLSDAWASSLGPRVGVDVAALSLAAALRIGELGTFVLPLARRGRSSVLRRSSPFSETLRNEAREWRKLQARLERARAAAAGWREPLARDDARAALAVAEARERSWLRFLDGTWRRVQSTVRASYGGTRRAVETSVTEALELLVAQHDAEAAVEAARAAAVDAWGYDDVGELSARVDALRRTDDPAVAEWRDRLAAEEEEELAAALADALTDLERARAAVAVLVDDFDHVPLRDLVAALEALASPRLAGLVRAAAPALRSMATHPEVARALRRLHASPDELEYAVCAAALDEALATRPAVARFDGVRLAELIARVQALLPALFEADAAVIVGRVRRRFLDEAAHAARSVTGMTPEDRQRKKTWTVGRRELENEFRKVMRYRSIRDIASGETGAVVAALRPIWLMSPTSVSDTLPLARTLFDVVIYDEASQIPVEEAVPAMHRADQVIVVGDRMQLPPTRFFTARSDLVDDDDGDEIEVGVVLDGDSFLAQAAGRLPSTMLTWHYRSRYESLIAFSNAAFYDGRLATIPDREPRTEPRPDIRVDLGGEAGTDEAEARAGVDALLARPISLHRLDGSPYEHRTNPGEAGYIARLVRELLSRETGLTIGIVAFSEAQQTEIERALERLASADPEFAARYEAELAREDEEQVVGLFVKNLENVQGDERDIILMSVCYGPDANGRMAMNFGPINQEGGEKRLNVIFSRARVHMAIVSSVDAEQITNTYNDGANTLRRFLEYAAAVSRGDEAAAERIASGLRERQGRGSEGAPRSAAVAQLAAALRERGLVVAEHVGQSAFRIDLAVRRPEDERHQVAVLVDHEARVRAQPLGERVINHPGVLSAAGWRVVPVLSKDWHEDSRSVVAAVERAVGEHGPAAVDTQRVVEEALAAAVPTAAADGYAVPGAAGVASPARSVGAASSGRDAGVGIQLEPTDESLVGRSVCFTGPSACSIGGVRLSREDQERLARQAGLDVRQSVSSRLDVLVLSDLDSGSYKARRAAELGVRRIAEPTFWHMVGVDVDER